MARVPDEFLKPIVFLGYQDPTGAGFHLVGSAFAVSFPMRDWDDSQYPPEPLNYVADEVRDRYLVTAGHVINRIRAKGDGRVLVRMNAKGGGLIDPMPSLPVDAWALHEPLPDGTTVDIAVATFRPYTNYDLLNFPIESAAVPTRVRHAGLGIGDDLLVPGLFRNHPGDAANIPVLRGGMLASVWVKGSEPVRSKSGPLAAHLIEIRSIGGMSGSPVMVHLSGLRQHPDSYGDPDGIDWRHHPMSELYLLGVMHGHWEIETESDNENVNMGIGMVVPVDYLLDLLRQDRFKEERAALMDEYQKEIGEPVLDTAESDRSSDSSYGRDDFLADLHKATKPLPQQPDREEA